MSTIKQQRTATQIRTIVSDLFTFQLSDPRLSGLTVTDVKIDRELQHANIYVHALGEDEREPEVMAGLEHANGYIRREVARKLQLRSAPYLHFHWDPTLAHAEHINELLDNLDIPPANDDEDDNLISL
ncbi:MAG: 30S ribosome-binding factor RbfA [Anaerolineae bacterium]|nr:30S ribosome-binding factor RbfA [Anaerolineae bacterium]MCO5190117.1 30S ribosome-binding factor RbfA [Anaerolineae bacterium]MCO5194889.1 30S ribosome-binding factor RbfA [Anaerolineae bacterium]MCO5199251.1 30S ribosome-binding factor RbfA [Anaerolineae bacterium]MCO5207740.1 30S ribosome-binding factor RbfA [Anaerolineae bacterium]